MTKTNRFTLLVTILLGILLFTILRFANDLNVTWDGRVLEPPATTDDAFESKEPQIAGAADLRAVLNAVPDIDPEAALESYSAWSDARGFTDANRLFGTLEDLAFDDFTAIDDTELNARSDTGDAGASQALAGQILFTDSVAAIALFNRAAEQGSTHALLRIASLLEALDDADGKREFADSSQRSRASDLAELGIGGNLRLNALSYVIAAVRDGGAPIVDRTVLAWLDRLASAAASDELAAACESSERTLLDIAGHRVRKGKSPVTTIAPPVFFAIPDLADRLPCRRTGHPIENLLDLTDCTVIPVRNTEDEDLNLYICAGG